MNQRQNLHKKGVESHIRYKKYNIISKDYELIGRSKTTTALFMILVDLSEKIKWFTETVDTLAKSKVMIQQ